MRPMPRTRPPHFLLGCLLLPASILSLSTGCKDPEEQAKANVDEEVAKRVAAGREHLAGERWMKAANAFRAAQAIKPDDPLPALLLAEALERDGSDNEAILALKQATDLTKGADPSLRKQLADLYERAGYPDQAIAVLAELLEANVLTDEEVLGLATAQAHAGDTDSAFATLERIQRRSADDPKAKVVEAEILLLSGDEVLAASLMDRLATEQPNSVPIRLLRARYFLNNARADLAEKDISSIKGASAELPEVVELRAKVLNAQERYEEAQTALEQLVSSRPDNPELLAQLAETKLYLRQFPQAEALIDKALAERPRHARSLFVRGMAREAQGQLNPAEESYRRSLREDPYFPPPISRMWRLALKRGEKLEAVNWLERLFFINGASLEEKVQLTQLYADLKINGWRARKLIDDALRRDPGNAAYKALKAQVLKIPNGQARPKSRGVVIWRGR